jgi:hypothetical protein
MKIGVASLGGTVFCVVPDGSRDYAVDSTLLTWSDVLGDYEDVLLAGLGDVELVPLGEANLYSRVASVQQWASALQTFIDAAEREGVSRVAIACGTNAIEVPLALMSGLQQSEVTFVFFGSPIPYSHDPLYSLTQMRESILVARGLQDGSASVLVADGIVHDAGAVWKESTTVPSFTSAPVAPLGRIRRASTGVSVAWDGEARPVRAQDGRNSWATLDLPSMTDVLTLFVVPALAPPSLPLPDRPSTLLLVVTGGGGLPEPWVNAVRAWSADDWRVCVAAASPLHPVTWTGYSTLPVELLGDSPARAIACICGTTRSE